MPLSAYPARHQCPHLLESVRVPDGRVGTVIGFYLRKRESVVVRFSPGEVDEFAVTDVQRQ
jgi:hypothetical protein